MNNLEFANLARERLFDAEALLERGRFSGAYYIAGYAVECALKACIAAKTRAGDFPPRDTSKIWTHDFAFLLKSAGLDEKFEEAAKEDDVLAKNWAVLKDWKESYRYDNRSDREGVVALLDAIKSPNGGVLTWLQKFW